MFALDSKKRYSMSPKISQSGFSSIHTYLSSFLVKLFGCYEILGCSSVQLS